MGTPTCCMHARRMHAPAALLKQGPKAAPLRPCLHVEAVEAEVHAVHILEQKDDLHMRHQTMGSGQ